MESFIAKFRDELLNGEIFDTLLEASVVTEAWRREYNPHRPIALWDIDPRHQRPSGLKISLQGWYIDKKLFYASIKPTQEIKYFD